VDPLATALYWFDYAAVFVFGATGALAAARGKHDIVTFAFFAAFTGVGGGTLRDLLIGVPVFWVGQPAYLLVTTLAAVAVWVLGPRRFRERAINWLDALGLAGYAVFGAAKATAVGVHPASAVAMGVLTAAFGGVFRDVLAGEPSILLRREIYITAALLAAVVFVGLQAAGLPTLPAGVAGFAAGFGLRACALVFGLAWPGFKPRDEP
jgi:uncharacterized membrane protein YeiH